MRFPPGKEIYRKLSLSVFEVDGKDTREYSSKVSTFAFILSIITLCYVSYLLPLVFEAIVIYFVLHRCVVNIWIAILLNRNILLCLICFYFKMLLFL